MPTDLKYYLSRITNKIKKARFDAVSKNILNTKPIENIRSDDVVIVCQVHKAALYMALIALKSFMKNFARGRLELINDGSLSKNEESLFQDHFPSVNFTHIEDIARGACPKGGCWERLVHISNLATDNYVIQVDSDTLTTKPLPLIDNLVNSNRCFLIGAPVWDSGISLEYMSYLAKDWGRGHVQVEGERVLKNIKTLQIPLYLRGCAAFSGFARDPEMPDKLQSLSEEMEELVGSKKWREWGSEQLTSNLLVSSYPKAKMLPWPQYQNFDMPRVTDHGLSSDCYKSASIIHFIGETRFNRGIYKGLSLDVLSQLET